MASTAKVDYIGAVFEDCSNHINCTHGIVTAQVFHPPGLHGLTSWKKTNKSDTIWLYTFFTHWLKMLKSFLTMSMHATIPQAGHFQEIKSWKAILLNTFQALTFCIHDNKAIPNKDIWVTTTLNDLFSNTPAIFKWHCVDAFSTTQKWQGLAGHLPVANFVKTRSDVFCPSPNSTYLNIMAVQETAIW